MSAALTAEEPGKDLLLETHHGIKTYFDIK